ncbi:MAG: twin-arginine translocase subunit TatC [Lachnospiraceae bacterium]|nr:twin-arginine translocase subunit TatC [Lachnospiraceae bacterium]
MTGASRTDKHTAPGKETLQTKPLTGHLKDLRRLLIFMMLLVFAVFLVFFLMWPKELVALVSDPIREMGIEIIYTNVSEAFTTQIKLCFIAAVVCASPVLFFAIWRFIRPALYKKERRAFSFLAVAAFLLFVTGVSFAWLMVFRLAVNFLVFSGENIATPMLSLENYVSFLFSFLVPFGIVFEMPVVIVILTRFGIVSTGLLTKARKYVVLVIFTLAAILTPPDVVSQVMLGLPMLVLYEAGILLSRLVKPREPQQDEEQPAV